MSSIGFEPYFTYYNPYKEGFEQSSLSTRATSDKTNNTVTNLSDAIYMRGSALVYRNYEKQIDLAGKIASVLDWSAFGFVYLCEFYMALDHFTSREKILRFSNLLSIASSGTFLGLGIIEGVVETANLYRTTHLLKNLRANTHSSEQKWLWLKDHYFSLRKTEVIKIHAYIESSYKESPIEVKAMKYDIVARKLLRNRFYALENRITPKLAREVGQQLRILTHRKTWKQIFLNDKSELRGEKLIQSIVRQAKNKIVFHVLNLIAVIITVVSMIILISGFIFPSSFISFTTISTSFVVMGYLIEKGFLNREVDFFHKALEGVNLSIEGDLQSISWNRLNPLHFCSGAPAN